MSNINLLPWRQARGRSVRRNNSASCSVCSWRGRQPSPLLQTGWCSSRSVTSSSAISGLQQEMATLDTQQGDRASQGAAQGVD